MQQLVTAGLKSSAGIKCDSKFNDLSFFHVCQAGLPPCLGHDLFEGVVSCDLALYIRHLITKQKEFSYVELNNRINHFRYLGSNANNKPSDVNPGSDKLSGHAVQNCCLLRVLPVLIGDKIHNPMDNDVRQIVELICAPKITTGQIAYLKVLIEEYLLSRTESFPDQPLKPKHHYLMHYLYVYGLYDLRVSIHISVLANCTTSRTSAPLLLKGICFCKLTLV